MKINSNSSEKELLDALNNGVSLKVIREIIKHTNASNIVLEKAVEIATKFDFSSKESILVGIAINLNVTPNILEKIIESSSSKNTIIVAINASIVNMNVLDKAVEVANKLDYNSKESILMDITTNPKSTPDIYAISRYIFRKNE